MNSTLSIKTVMHVLSFLLFKVTDTKANKNLLALIQTKKNDRMRKDDFMIISDPATFNSGYRATYHAQ